MLLHIYPSLLLLYPPLYLPICLRTRNCNSRVSVLGCVGVRGFPERGADTGVAVPGKQMGRYKGGYTNRREGASM